MGYSSGMTKLALLVLATAVPLLSAAGQQVTTQDLEEVLKKADVLLEESRKAYDEAKSKGSLPSFLEANFKLEEVRIKYLVLQELGQGELQKTAGARLRTCNQLQKLINDGKVAVSDKPAGSPAPRPVDPAAPAPEPPPPLPTVEKPVAVNARPPVPDAEKQKVAEKAVKDLFKEQYAKKGVADRRVLGRQLLIEAGKSQSDPAALWVLCREAQEVSTQTVDVGTANQAIEFASEFFDLDSIALKSAALTTMTKQAKTSDDGSAICFGLLKLVEEMVAADLFEAAEKTTASAILMAKKSGDAPLLARATLRSKELAEAKSLFQSSKNVLETLAKKPEDPAANLEMGKFLCFVKGSWDLGLRFIVKGPENPVRAAAERELALPTAAADRAAVADAWFDLAEKEKSTLRKGRMLAHAKEAYQGALQDSEGLLRSRIEKRLGQMADPGDAPVTRSTHKITITKARFMANGKPFDIAGELQDAYDKNPGTPIRCDDYPVPGKAFLGQMKALFIEGTLDGKPFKESIEDGEVFVLPKIPAAGLASPKASQRFMIIEAYLGKGTTWTDVTEIIRAKVTDPTQQVPQEITGLDPYPGTIQVLALIFEIRGKRYLKWAATGSSIVPMRK